MLMNQFHYTNQYINVNILIFSICAGCCQDRGERTREAYEKVVKPDYSKLFTVGIWVEALLPGSQKKI